MRRRLCYYKGNGVDIKLRNEAHTNKDYEEFNQKQDDSYWRLMYEELEMQMKNMMEMTLELIDKELANKGHSKKEKVHPVYSHAPKDLQKELRRLQLFEHRIRVTWIGKLALAYIGLKKRVKTLIKGK